MNRHERRIAASKSKRKPIALDAVVAVHEAGHAVARYVTAEDMGLSHDDCIAYIDIGHNIPLRMSADKTKTMVSSATTYGPIFSVEIDAVVIREATRQMVGTKENITHDEIVRVLALAAAEGADITKWLDATALICVLGPIAEAAATEKDCSDVLESYECESDVADIIRNCLYAGLDGDQPHAIIEKARQRGIQLILRPEICAAINALAKELREMGVGRMQGKYAAAIINRALTGSA